MKKLSALTFLFLANSSVFAQKLYEIKSADDNTYGYSIKNPIKIRAADSLKTVEKISDYINHLKTLDGQLLLWLTQETVYSAKRKLDKCTLEAEKSRERKVFYLDLENEGAIYVPVGLKIETTEYKGPKIILGHK